MDSQDILRSQEPILGNAPLVQIPTQDTQVLLHLLQQVATQEDVFLQANLDSTVTMDSTATMDSTGTMDSTANTDTGYLAIPLSTQPGNLAATLMVDIMGSKRNTNIINMAMESMEVDPAVQTPTENQHEDRAEEPY